MGQRVSGDRGPFRLGRSLEQLLGTLRAPSVDVLDSVFTKWALIVGDDVAAHSRPVSIDGATLVVEASDPTWASELRWLEKEVLERLTEVAGTNRVRTLEVRVARRK